MRRCLESDFYDCCIDEAHEEGWSCSSGMERSLQGLSGVGNVCVGRDIPELRAMFCGYVNSNGILYNEEIHTPPPPPLINGVFYVPCHLLKQQGSFVFLSTFSSNRRSLCSLPRSEAIEDLCAPVCFLFLL